MWWIRLQRRKRGEKWKIGELDWKGEWSGQQRREDEKQVGEGTNELK